MQRMSLHALALPIKRLITPSWCSPLQKLLTAHSRAQGYRCLPATLLTAHSCVPLHAAPAIGHCCLHQRHQLACVMGRLSHAPVCGPASWIQQPHIRQQGKTAGHAEGRCCCCCCCAARCHGDVCTGLQQSDHDDAEVWPVTAL
jgi:hypothetical protein